MKQIIFSFKGTVGELAEKLNIPPPQKSPYVCIIHPDCDWYE